MRKGMNMKKKNVFVLYALCLLMLTGCGNKNNSTDTDDNSSESSSVQVDNAKEGNDAGIGQEYPMKEIVVAENESFKFTAKRAAIDDAGNFIIDVVCENNTKCSANFDWYNSYLNNYQVFTYWNEQVAAGESKESTIIFEKEDYERCGITSVDKVEFWLHAAADDDSDELSVKDCKLYPTELSDDKIIIPDPVQTEGAKTVLDTDTCKLIVLGVETNKHGNTALNLYIENKSSEQAGFYIDEAVFNGTDVGTLISEAFIQELQGGKRIVYQFYNYDLNSDFTDISDVKDFSFKLKPMKGYSTANPFTEESVSYTN